MRALIAVMILLLGFGCLDQQNPANQTTADQTIPNQSAPNQTTTDNTGSGSDSGSVIGEEQNGQTQPYVNTSGIYFERNVSDVMNANTTFPEPENITYDFSNMTTEDGRLIVYYFHSSACSACKALRPDIDRLEAKYPDVLWLEYDLVDDEGHNAYNQFAAQRNLTTQQMYVPQVLVDDTVITDIFNINQSLEGLIKNFSAG